MLYKKYHRSYVRQFKKGVKVSRQKYILPDKVVRFTDISIDDGSVDRSLIYSDGVINHCIKVEEYVI